MPDPSLPASNPGNGKPVNAGTVPAYPQEKLQPLYQAAVGNGSKPPEAIPVAAPPKPAAPVAAVAQPDAARKPVATDASVELEPNAILPAPGQIPVTLERITTSGQLKSVTDHGQFTDAIVYTSPDLPPGKVYCADGNGLVLCCRVLGRKVKCKIIDHAPSKAELRRMRTATHFHRKGKAAAQAQLEADIEEEMGETGATLTQAAAAIGISPGYACKIRSDSKLIPELHHLRQVKEICRDARRIIATMKAPEHQKTLAEKALATIKAGGVVKRDLVQGWADELKTGKKSKEKQVKVKVTVGGVTVIFSKSEFGPAYNAIDQVKGGLQKCEKHQLPLSSLQDILKG